MQHFRERSLVWVTPKHAFYKHFEYNDICNNYLLIDFKILNERMADFPLNNINE